MSPHAPTLPAVQWDLHTRSGWKPWAASQARTARGIARTFWRSGPNWPSETLIPQEWLNLALSDATAAAVKTLRAGAPIGQAPSWM